MDLPNHLSTATHVCLESINTFILCIRGSSAEEGRGSSYFRGHPPSQEESLVFSCYCLQRSDESKT